MNEPVNIAARMLAIIGFGVFACPCALLNAISLVLVCNLQDIAPLDGLANFICCLFAMVICNPGKVTIRMFPLMLIYCSIWPTVAFITNWKRGVAVRFERKAFPYCLVHSAKQDHEVSLSDAFVGATVKRLP